MADYNFPCPVCCKHIPIKRTEWIKGGIVRCPACGNAMRMKPHAPWKPGDETTQKTSKKK